MASEDTLLGNELTFQVGDAGSPEQFVDMCAVIDIGGLGEQKDLVEVTAICDTARTYRNAMADGQEFPLQVNFIQGDAQTRAVYAAFKDDAVLSFRMALKDHTDEYFEFRAIVRGWSIAPPINQRATMTFTLKVTGEVTWVQGA